MATKLPTGEFQCSCGKVYESIFKADICLDSHTTIFVPMTKTEFNRLTMALELGDYNLIPESLRATFSKVRKAHFRN